MTNGLQICGLKCPPGSKARGWVKIVDSAEGPLNLPLILVAGAAPGTTLYVQAGLHGDEYDGLEASLRVADQVDPARLSGNLVIVPRVNMPAFVAGARINRIDGQDLNRVWPGRANGYLTEQIAHFVTQNILPHVDCAIDLHGGNTELEVVSYGGWQDVPGFDAYACAGLMGLRHLWDWSGGLAKLPIFMVTAAKLGIPTLVVEIGGGNRWSEPSVSDGVRAIGNVMRHLGMLAGDYEGLPEEVLVLEGGFTFAAAGGFLRPRCRLGQTVRQGEVLAEIVSLLGEKVMDVVSPRDGVVNDIRSMPRILPGDWLYMVGTVKARIKTAEVRGRFQRGFRRRAP